MLLVLGASHHDLDLADLDRLTADPETLVRMLRTLAGPAPSPVAGLVVLATCNRLEIYADVRRFHDAVDVITAQVAESSGLAAAEVAALLQVRVGAPVVAHLFRVASGLDSMVVGEAEVSGQVAAALHSAQRAHVATPVLNRLFQMAARTAKRVASEAPQGPAGRSVVTVALDLAGAANPLRVLIIGTGAYARVVVAELRRRGSPEVGVHSPSGRAAAFAESHGAVVVPAGDLAGALADADLVVACSGRGRPVVGLDVVAAATAGRETPLVVLDLALHSDLPSGLRSVAGVRVVDLVAISAATGGEHRESAAAAADIVIDAVAAFEDEMAARKLDPAVVALRRHVATAVETELRRFRVNHDPAVAADVERAMHRLAQALLHVPTVRAKELARNGDGAGYIKAVHTLFGIDPDAGDGTAGVSEPRPQPPE